MMLGTFQQAVIVGICF